MSHQADINTFLHPFLSSKGLRLSIYNMEAYLNNVRADLSLEDEDLKEMTAKFKEELELGLEKHNQTLRALPTFVYRLPKGTEKGKYLTVDLGGTNLRVGLIELLGSGKFAIEKASFIIPETLKTGSGEKIFEFIAENVKEFLARPEVQAELPLKLGFTFSFPIEQESLSHGRIIGWSKEIECPDVIGKDAVELLQKALHRLGLDIAVEALVNDTVGTLLAQIYRDSRTKMSVILGTGSNAAYVESCANIRKLAIEADHTVINIEWGSFGEDSPSNLPTRWFDRLLDSESRNSGHQKFEKMISGMYLGEIFRLILAEGVKRKVLTRCEDSKSTSKLDLIHGIGTEEMSEFHQAYIEKDYIKCSEIGEGFGIECENGDGLLQFIAELCELISLRSCKLCAVGITAIYRHVHNFDDEEEVFLVAVDGSLYQKYPNYAKILQDMVCSINSGPEANSCKIELVMAEDLSSVGAAAAIAAQKE